MRKGLLWVAAIGSACLAIAVPLPASAANWFQLQGISRPAWGKAKWTFFVQPQYSSRLDSEVEAAGRRRAIRPNLVGPEFSSDRRLTVFRARAMLRGNLAPGIAYFLGAEAGDDGYTYADGHYTPRLIDAHVTFSGYIPGIRIEVGNIRAPGPESAMQGYVAYNFYDLFPTVTGQLMQTRFYATDTRYHTNPKNGGYLIPDSDLSSTSGFRYPGIEAFDCFRPGKNLELGYGVMVASYGKWFVSDTSNGLISAGRVQLSYLLGGGRGAFRNDVTGFVWYQNANPEINGVSHTMERYGAGVTFRDGFMKAGGVGLEAEYMKGRGNIMVPRPFIEAPDLRPPQYQTTYFVGSNSTADGYYVSGGVFVSRHVELTARYGRYDRLPNSPADERVFRNLGVGIEYHVSPKTKIVADYFWRDLDIPHIAALGPPGSLQRGTATHIQDSFGNVFNVWGIVAF